MNRTQCGDGISTLIEHKALNICPQTVRTQSLESDTTDTTRGKMSAFGKERDVIRKPPYESHSPCGNPERDDRRQ